MNKSTRTLIIIFALLAVIYFLFFRTKERVSTDKIDAMLLDLKNFMIDDEASNNPAKFNEYLDTAFNSQVTAYQEGKLLGTFILGKTASSFDVSYIKKPEEERILRASSISSANFNKQIKDFRNKFIISISTKVANKITFKSTDTNKVDFTAIKDSIGRWKIDSDSVSSSVMDGFLNMFENWNT